jgi:hypothetical protein
MLYAITHEYQEHYIPPRCRKPRCRVAEATTEVEVRETTKENAPVAFRHFDLRLNEMMDGMRQEYRLFQGRLYCRVMGDRFSCNKTGFLCEEQLLKHLSRGYGYHDKSLEAVRSEIAAEANRFLLIDGEIWEETGEPRYCIYTFGLGHNHAGIGVSLSVVNFYNSNISKDRYFSALEYDTAVQTAIEIAVDRGDTDSLDFIRNPKYKIEVLIPEAVQTKPQAEAGEGNPLLNSFESLCEAAPNAAIAGILCLGEVAKSLG